jgi:hypothetical protein
LRNLNTSRYINWIPCKRQHCRAPSDNEGQPKRRTWYVFCVGERSKNRSRRECQSANYNVVGRTRLEMEGGNTTTLMPHHPRRLLLLRRLRQRRSWHSMAIMTLNILKVGTTQRNHPVLRENPDRGGSYRRCICNRRLTLICTL